MADNPYLDILIALSFLKEPVNDFFDKIYILSDDEATKDLRKNRFTLLKKVRDILTSVCDASMLDGPMGKPCKDLKETTHRVKKFLAAHAMEVNELSDINVDETLLVEEAEKKLFEKMMETEMLIYAIKFNQALCS